MAYRKEILDIRGFLGLNTYNDEYDIRKEEFTELYGVVNDRVGTLRTAGTVNTVVSIPNCGVVPGYNFGLLDTTNLSPLGSTVRAINGLKRLPGASGRYINCRLVCKIGSAVYNAGITELSNLTDEDDNPITTVVGFSDGDNVTMGTSSNGEYTGETTIASVEGDKIYVNGDYSSYDRIALRWDGILHTGEVYYFNFPGVVVGSLLVDKITSETPFVPRFRLKLPEGGGSNITAVGNGTIYRPFTYTSSKIIVTSDGAIKVLDENNNVTDITDVSIKGSQKKCVIIPADGYARIFNTYRDENSGVEKRRTVLVGRCTTNYLGYTKGSDVSILAKELDLRILENYTIGVGSTYPNTEGLNIYINTFLTSDDSLWQAGTYEVGIAPVFSDGQEGSVNSISQTFSIGSSQNYPKVTVYVLWEDGGILQSNGRLVGFRVYYREHDSGEDWKYFFDIHLNNGLRASLTGTDFVPFSIDESNKNKASATLWIYRPGVETHYAITGIDKSATNVAMLSAGEGANAVLLYNRRLFLAGVERAIGDRFVYNGSRIYYSLPGKYDTILDSNYIDVVVGESDEYVALAGYAGRLLAFRHNSLHIIDISNADPVQWRLLANIKPSGVHYQGHVITTKHGVVWLNNAGLFLYDGQNIRNLITGKLKPESISTYVTTDAVLFYDSIYDVVVVNVPGGTSLVYSFLTESFSTTNNFGTISNPVIDGSGTTLFLVESGTSAEVKEYSHTTDSRSFSLTTKTFDFGSPTVKKKVYSITIVYELPAGSANVFYVADGSSTQIGSLNATAGITTVTLNVGVLCNDIAFHIEGSGTFTLHNLFVEYRLVGR